MYTPEELQEIGRRVVRLPHGSVLEHLNSGGWDIRHKDGSEMSSIDVLETLFHAQQNANAELAGSWRDARERGYFFCEVCGEKRDVGTQCRNYCVIEHGTDLEPPPIGNISETRRRLDQKVFECRTKEPHWMAEADEYCSLVGAEFFAQRFLPTEETPCKADAPDSIGLLREN